MHQLEWILGGMCVGTDANIQGVGHEGRGVGSRSPGGFATTLMQKYVPWAKGREHFGADPRGELRKNKQWNHKHDMRVQRGVQSDFRGICFKSLSPQMSKNQPDRTTSDSTGVCPNFQHVRKNTWFCAQR